MAERDPRTYAVLGACLEVHRELGCGFWEAVFQEALACEFELRGIPFQKEVELPVMYKGKRLHQAYRVDFVCHGEVIVELKALAGLSSIEEAQVLNYLKASGLKTALLVNFGALSLEHRRFVL